MKIIKVILSGVLVTCIISSTSFSQGKEMMKKDSMKSQMMMKENMMKDNKMMKDDKMMKDKGMMHESMSMIIDKDMNGVAIKGYDPVAYFTDNKPMMGNKMYSYKWDGATWEFASEKHLTMFKENPGKYAPKYGGYCAYAVSKNKLASTDPTVWKIVDGKLYLNVNAEVGKLFREDLKGNIMKADKNWPGLNEKDKM